MALSAALVPIRAGPAADRQTVPTDSASHLSAHVPEGLGDWPMFRHDPAHSSANPFETTINKDNVGQLTLAWSHRIGKGRTFGGLASSPAVSEGGVYVGTYERLTAMDAVTGASRWHLQFGLGGIDSSPAVVDGAIYVGVDASVNRRVQAFDAATGATLWTFGTRNNALVRSSPSVVDGVVYIRTGDGFMNALDAATGKAIWSIAVSEINGADNESSAAVVDSKVYLSVEGGIEVLDAATGDILWQTACGFASSGQSASVVDGVVYAGADLPAFGQGILCAVNADTGELLWSVEPDQPGIPNVTVYGGIVYMILDDTIFALDAATGTTLWSRDPGFTIYGPPTVANGVLYTPGRGLAAAFDPANGDTLWTAVIHGRHSTALPVVANGRLYVAVGDDRLYAFELP